VPGRERRLVGGRVHEELVQELVEGGGLLRGGEAEGVDARGGRRRRVVVLLLLLLLRACGVAVVAAAVRRAPGRRQQRPRHADLAHGADLGHDAAALRREAHPEELKVLLAHLSKRRAVDALGAERFGVLVDPEVA